MSWVIKYNFHLNKIIFLALLMKTNQFNYFFILHELYICFLYIGPEVIILDPLDIHPF